MKEDSEDEEFHNKMNEIDFSNEEQNLSLASERAHKKSIT